MTETPALPSYLRRDGEFDPDPSLARIRADGGAAYVDTSFGVPGWLITGLDNVRAVLADTRRVSNDIPRDPQFPGQAEMSDEEFARTRAGNILGLDPPEHTRLRRMLTPAFTMRQMRRLEPWIAAIVTDHLDAMERNGPPVDLVQAFALPIPSLVICELLGVPYEDRAEFQRLSNRLLDLSAPPAERTARFQESQAYMAHLVAQQQANPGEELLGALIREHGDDLSTDELVGIGNILLIAGHETTANMLGLGTLALLRHPDQLELVRDRPDLVEPAVEELLRWLTIVTTTIARITTAPVEVGGHRIEAGELVLLSLPGANRDPALVSDPDTLDVTRGEIGHLAFGHGVHHCLGAPLARMEMRLAFPALLQRFPTLRLVHPEQQAELRVASLIHGVSVLPVTW